MKTKKTEDAPNGWRYVSHTEVPYKVHLNNMDDELLKLARTIVPRIVSSLKKERIVSSLKKERIVSNLKKAACVQQNTDPADITIGQLSQIWFITSY